MNNKLLTLFALSIILASSMQAQSNAQKLAIKGAIIGTIASALGQSLITSYNTLAISLRDPDGWRESMKMGLEKIGVNMADAQLTRMINLSKAQALTSFVVVPLSFWYLYKKTNLFNLRPKKEKTS